MAAIGDAGVEKGQRLLTYSQRGPRREALGGRPTPAPYPGRPPTHMGLVAFEASQQLLLASSEGFSTR